jgi:hypothetical protein
VYIVVNHEGKIEEVGADLHERRRMHGDEDLGGEPATEGNVMAINLIGDEYWWHVHNLPIRIRQLQRQARHEK